MKKLMIPAGLLLAITFQFCSSSKKAIVAKETKPIVHITTYNADVKPLILTKCTPCHVQPNGKKGFLDNYADAKIDAGNIIDRIKKNPTERGFMPFKKSERLSDSIIHVFEQWQADGLLEK
jgi:hypothetical protein